MLHQLLKQWVNLSNTLMKMLKKKMNLNQQENRNLKMIKSYLEILTIELLAVLLLVLLPILDLMLFGQGYFLC